MQKMLVYHVTCNAFRFIEMRQTTWTRLELEHQAGIKNISVVNSNFIMGGLGCGMVRQDEGILQFEGNVVNSAMVVAHDSKLVILFTMKINKLYFKERPPPSF